MGNDIYNYAQKRGQEIMLWVISLDNPKQIIITLVVLLLYVAFIIIILKALSLFWNRINITRVRRRLFQLRKSANHSSKDYKDFAISLLGKQSKGRNPEPKPPQTFIPGQLIFQYIYGLYTIRSAGGSYDKESLQEIAENKTDSWLGIPRFLAASFVLLGLLGTIIGLSRSMEKILPLIRSKEISDLNSLQEIVSVLVGTIQSMEVALHTTLSGLLGTLFLTIILVFYKQTQEYVLRELMITIQTEIVPRFFPAGWEEHSEIIEATQNLQEQNQELIKQTQTITTHNNNIEKNLTKVYTQMKTSFNTQLESHERLIMMENYLEKVEKVFDERFDMQLKALSHLANDLGQATENINLGGGRLTTFVNSFGQSMETQKKISQKIQDAQNEFNSIIKGFKEVIGEVQRDSGKVLLRVDTQQEQLENLLIKHDKTIEEIRSELNKVSQQLNLEAKNLLVERNSLLKQQNDWTIHLNNTRQELLNHLSLLMDEQENRLFDIQEKQSNILQKTINTQNTQNTQFHTDTSQFLEQFSQQMLTQFTTIQNTFPSEIKQAAETIAFATNKSYKEVHSKTHIELSQHLDILIQKQEERLLQIQKEYFDTLQKNTNTQNTQNTQFHTDTSQFLEQFSQQMLTQFTTIQNTFPSEIKQAGETIASAMNQSYEKAYSSIESLQKDTTTLHEHLTQRVEILNQAYEQSFQKMQEQSKQLEIYQDSLVQIFQKQEQNLQNNSITSQKLGEKAINSLQINLKTLEKILHTQINQILQITNDSQTTWNRGIQTLEKSFEEQLKNLQKTSQSTEEIENRVTEFLSQILTQLPEQQHTFSQIHKELIEFNSIINSLTEITQNIQHFSIPRESFKELNNTLIILLKEIQKIQLENSSSSRWQKMLKK